MTEKQIFKRMNEAYEQIYGDCIEDEWYGNDSPTIWRFHRPIIHLEVEMVMDIEAKRIDLFERHEGEYTYRKVGNYTWTERRKK